MKERIRMLRKDLGMTLEEFGNEIGIKKNSLSQIENGKNNITEQTILAICRTKWNGKYVNENWLRFAKGNMYVELDRETEIAEMVSALFKEESDSFKFRFIKALCNMDDKGWDVLESLVKDITK